MARVFLLEPINQATHDAERFGELVYLFGNGAKRSSIFRTKQFGEQLIEQLERHSYHAARDLVAISGNVAGIAIMAATIAKQYGEFSALLFNAQKSEYVQVTLG